MGQGVEVKPEHQGAAAVAPGISPTAGGNAQATSLKQGARPPYPPQQPPSTRRRGIIIGGSASIVTLGAWGLLNATLPSPSRVPASMANATPASQALPAQSPSGTTYALVPMSPEEDAAFRPTVHKGMANTNQEAKSPCPEALARLSLISTAQSQGQIRVTSGTYTSPWYQLAKGPMAFVLPFPAPYQTGKGTLVVEGNGEHGVLALNPGMELNFASATAVTIPVIWDVRSNCR